MTVVDCPTIQSFREELKNMAECYGPPPPAFIAYDKNWQRTEYYDERPAV